MKVRHTLICFIFLILQDGNTGLVAAKIYVEKGGNVTVGCSFSFLGSRKFFCKDECEEGNILIETKEDTAQRDRYSIKYIKRFLPNIPSVLYVSITQLEIADSGHYRCSLDKPLYPNSYEDFNIVVTGGASAPTEASNTAVSVSFVVVVVCLAVVVMVLLLTVVLLIYKKKREDCVCLKKRRNTEHNRTEVVLYDDCPPVSTCDDSTYQSLNPASRDQDQIYSTLGDI